MSERPWSSPLDGLPAEVYEICLKNGPLPPAELKRHLDVSSARVERAVDELVALGLVHCGAQGEVLPLQPRQALAGMAQELEDTAEEVRGQSLAWQQLWRRHYELDDYVEVLTQERDVAHFDRSMLQSVRREVRSMQVAMIGPPKLRPTPATHPMLAAALERGVRFRVVYGVSVLRDPVILSVMQKSIDLGEEARVFPEVPLGLVLTDDSLAAVMVPGAAGTRKHTVLVHPSGLLDSLIELFECFWRMSVPLGNGGQSATDEGPDNTSRQLLAYLGAGLTDESIARELGVSERTVGRRIAQLQQRLGAHSRFQLALQAMRRGWI